MVTLTDAAGNILWRTGEPWRIDRPFSWNGDWNDFCTLADLDGDGRFEIAVAHDGHDGVVHNQDGCAPQKRHLDRARS